MEEGIYRITLYLNIELTILLTSSNFTSLDKSYRRKRAHERSRQLKDLFVSKSILTKAKNTDRDLPLHR